jgi:hypothetical protein
MHLRTLLPLVLASGLLACTGAVGGGDIVGGESGSDEGVGADTEGTPDSDPGGDTAAGADTTTPPDDTTPPPPPPDTAPPPPPPDTGDTLASARVTCVDEINKYRATLSLAPYAGWTAAEPCVDGQAKADSESGVAHSAFGKCSESAQNECPGWPGPPATLIVGCLKMMWAEGPGVPFSAHGHYINMSSTSYTSVACGFYQMPSGSWWAAQDFR